MTTFSAGTNATAAGVAAKEGTLPVGRSKSKIVKKVLLTLAALAVVGVGGFYGYRYWRAQRAPRIHYETTPVDRGHIAAKVTATGTLSALVTVVVGAQVSGRLETIRADFNSVVKKNQIIATLEPSLFQAAVQQAQANSASARADVEKATAQSVDADRQYERAKLLFSQKLIAEADYQTAEANANVAKAQVASAKAETEQARAQLNQAEVNLKYTTIHSPIDGVVISRSVDVGQTVAASLQAPTLFTIAQDLTKMQVDTSVSEGDVGKIRDKMHVTFTVDAYPTEHFDGVVRQVRDAPTTVQNVVTYDAVIDVDNSKKLLKPGMTANVTFVHAEKDDILRVSNAALRFRPDDDILKALAGPAASAKPPTLKPTERQIWVLRGRRPTRVIMVPGITDGSMSEVVSGDVREGDAAISEVIGVSTTTGKGTAPPSGLPFGAGAQRGGGRRGP